MPRKKRSKRNSKKHTLKVKQFKFRMYIMLFIFFLISVAYLSFQYKRILDSFNVENQSPIEIYSSSLELFVGKKIKKQQLINYLQELGYIKIFGVVSPNSYSIKGNELIIYIDDFKLPKEIINKQKVIINVFNNQIISLFSVSKNKNINFVTLQPIKLTSVHSGVYTDYQPIKLDDVPKAFIQSLLLIEDKRFYSHWGFDPASIARAAMRNVKAGKVVQGASTLTQQYVKGRYLNNQRSFIRKIKELIISVILETHFTKNEILEAYINSVFLGQKGNYRLKGFNLASHYFFGKNLNDLNISQIASLVALVKAPSSYKIQKGNKKALTRRNLILGVLAKNQLISPSLLKIAKKYPLRSKKHLIGTNIFSTYIGLVLNELTSNDQSIQWHQKNKTVYTHLDINIQIALQKIISKQVAILESNKGYSKNTLEASAIIIDKNNGNILAAVANRNDKRFGWNRILHMKRPIGSLIKPFVYYTALDKFNYQTNSVLSDRRTTVSIKPGVKWRPNNYDKKSHGDVLLSEALSHSYNLATVNLGLKIGVNNIIKTLNDVGYTKKLPQYASLLLGATEMSPLEIASLYQPLANDGFKSPLRTISKALDNDVITIDNSLVSQKVINFESLLKLNSILKDVPVNGTARSLTWRLKQKGQLLYGKTGTSNKLKDSWYIGYDKDYLIVVWVGRDDNKSSGYSGSSGALPIYAAIKNYLDIE